MTTRAVIPAFVSAALEDRPLHLYGDGLQTRDFTFVDTVVSTLVDAVARRVWQITRHQPTTSEADPRAT
jgi:nucleoside-diphosphate-sugar epimerase